MRLKDLKIGYVPLDKNFDHPGDLRRFCYFAEKRNIKFERANPSEVYDLVILSQNADISIWSEYQKGNCKIIYDFVDSYLNVPPWNLKGLLRGTAKYFAGQSRYLRLNHWKALQAMCQRADAVACSTEEQKKSILPFCNNVHVILDFHFTLMRSTKVDYSAGKPFNLVWEGMPGNLKFVFEISEVLEELSAKYDIAFHAVTDLSYGKYMRNYCIRSTLPLAKKIFKNSYVHEWKAENLASTISSFDLAIIPIPLDKPFGLDNSLAIGKPENKLLLLWRMGMPTVVSATLTYQRVMDQCGLPMTCRTQDEWFNTLEKYINDDTLRREAGQNGKSFVENNCSEDILLSKWDDLFSSIVLSRNKG
jgi:hypothetical protein